MATITLGGDTVHTKGNLPEKGGQAPDFNLAKNDLTNATLADYAGKKIIMNIFPSIDTGVCANSVRAFNKKAVGLENTTVLCISRDLPFAQARFTGNEGLDKVVNLSDFRTGKFGEDYQLAITDGPFEGLLSRVVIVLDEEGTILYAQQVPEIGQEPDYDAALKHLD